MFNLVCSSAVKKRYELQLNKFPSKDKDNVKQGLEFDIKEGLKNVHEMKRNEMTEELDYLILDQEKDRNKLDNLNVEKYNHEKKLDTFIEEKLLVESELNELLAKFSEYQDHHLGEFDELKKKRDLEYNDLHKKHDDEFNEYQVEFNDLYKKHEVEFNDLYKKFNEIFDDYQKEHNNEVTKYHESIEELNEGVEPLQIQINDYQKTIGQLNFQIDTFSSRIKNNVEKITQIRREIDQTEKKHNEMIESITINISEKNPTADITIIPSDMIKNFDDVFLVIAQQLNVLKTDVKVSGIKQFCQMQKENGLTGNVYLYAKLKSEWKPIIKQFDSCNGGKIVFVKGMELRLFIVGTPVGDVQYLLEGEKYSLKPQLGKDKTITLKVSSVKKINYLCGAPNELQKNMKVAN
jgi:hypothetical protein